MNETLRLTDECRVQCEVASQRLPEDRGVDSVSGVFEKAAGKRKKEKNNNLPQKTTAKTQDPLLFSSLLFCSLQLCHSPCWHVDSTA